MTEPTNQLDENCQILKRCEYAKIDGLENMDAQTYRDVRKKLSDVSYWVFELDHAFQEEDNRRFALQE